MNGANVSWWADLWRALMAAQLGFGEAELRLGRTLARRTDRAAIEVVPGMATVRFAARSKGLTGGAEGSTVVAQLGVEPFDEQRRTRAVAVTLAQPALWAAVLVGELPAALARPWAEAGIELVPRVDEVSLDCSCGEWTGDRCHHLAALGELLARVIDDQPFVLLTLRGWEREAFLQALRTGRAGHRGMPRATTSPPRGEDPGVAAAERFARLPDPLPALRPLPRRAGSAPTLPDAPVDSGIDQRDVVRLINDAAARAVALLNSDQAAGSVSSLYLPVPADLARLAAELTDDPMALADLAARAGVEAQWLATKAHIWRVGGPDGLAVSEETWAAPVEALAPGRIALEADRGPEPEGATLRISANWVIRGRVQLRLDHRAHWWRFEADEVLGWLPVAGPVEDPEELFGVTG